MKAIAFCGLACCVCSENKGCVGCQDGGCESHGWCKNYNCCKEKGLNGLGCGRYYRRTFTYISGRACACK